MGQYRRKVRLEPETVGKQKIDTLFAKFGTEITVTIKYLPDN